MTTTLPVRERWRVELSDWAQAAPVLVGDHVVARVRGDLRAFDVVTGAAAWTVAIDPHGSSGVLTIVAGETLIADRRTRPQRLTEAVVVRGGKAISTAVAGGVIARDCAAVHGDLLYALVTDHARGAALRTFDLASGAPRLDVSLRDLGAASLRGVGDRLLLCTRTGLAWLGLDGAMLGVLERARTTDVKVAGGTALAAVTADGITARAYDLPSGRVRWSAAAAQPVIALADEHAASFDAGAPRVPVVRDAVTGEVIWRGEELPDDPARAWFAGPWLFVEHTGGSTAYASRDGRKHATLRGTDCTAWLGGALYVCGYDYLACCSLDVSA